jgi:Ras-related protein Rab-32
LLQEGHGQPINQLELDDFCRQNGFARWFDTSAKDNSNIDEAARYLIQTIVSLEEEHGSLMPHGLDDDDDDDDSIRLDQYKHRSNSGNGCC